MVVERGRAERSCNLVGPRLQVWPGMRRAGAAQVEGRAPACMVPARKRLHVELFTPPPPSRWPAPAATGRSRPAALRRTWRSAWGAGGRPAATPTSGCQPWTCSALPLWALTGTLPKRHPWGRPPASQTLPMVYVGPCLVYHLPWALAHLSVTDAPQRALRFSACHNECTWPCSFFLLALRPLSCRHLHRCPTLLPLSLTVRARLPLT